ncbi:universal stress protein [Kitasatospora viridis]|uniref:Nucleotide-binding universal stress UspA family protein n=1 Tax=Kitasatospora viridis TaxID=281105 RepID=A0A561TV77_9ACTN|nr:universal stress protein [Kitasatospora viridis]TWF91001.1 nucleotide-binding universal stress UspA family protein [Kitasatospora viridis]
MQPEITVGLDGSAESLAAARWAAHEAELRGLPVRLLHLWLLPSMWARNVPDENSQGEAAQRVLQHAEGDLLARFPRVPVITELVPADTAAELLPAASNAVLLVLGSQGLGAVQGYVLGSVALHAVARSERPVVLVRAPEEPAEVGADGAPPGPVAVGVSLRPGYRTVLEFAFGAAARRGVPLLALHTTGHRRSFLGREAPPDEAARQAAREQLHEALRPWREKFPAVHVVEHLGEESPARAVVDIAPGAGLLVVGRGHRAGPGPRTGPVAHAAVHHATCPVAVVPHD